MSTKIVWSAIIDGQDSPCVTRETTSIYAMVTPEPPDAAAQALAWWLDDTANCYRFEPNWNVEIGEDAVTAHAVVMIHEPASAAGLYAVELTRQIVGNGYPCGDGDRPEERAKLAAIPAPATTEPAP